MDTTTLAHEDRNVKLSQLKLEKVPETLYHITFDPDLPDVLIPRLPYGDSGSDTWDAEPNIPRVSFSSTLEGCIRGVYPNISGIMGEHGKEGVDFHVYELDSRKLKGVSPKELAKRAVHDAEVTSEWWITEPAPVAYIGKITATCDWESEWLKYKPFGMPEKEHSPKIISITPIKRGNPVGLNDVLNKLNNKRDEEIATVAQEAISTEVEKEYCVWVQPTQAGWEWIRQQHFKCIVDILLPMEGARRRVRIAEGAAVGTMKRHSENGTKETHSELDLDYGLSMHNLSTNIHVFKRITLDAPELATRAGEAHWDIDCFYTNENNLSAAFNSVERFTELVGDANALPNVAKWVKVELEVERFFVETIRDLIPFEVGDIMAGRPKAQEEQAEISHMWDTVTNWK